MFHYWAYGLRVKSNVLFPELVPIDCEQDSEVSIAIAIEPNSVLEIDASKSSLLVEETFYRLQIPKVAVYEVSNGDSIIIYPIRNSSEDAIRLFCLSNAFAALLQQRGLIPLHCAAVQVDGKTVLIFGHSGSGKSTTLMGLMQKGYPIISDDVVVPFLNSNSIFILSSYPMIKLWKETVDHFGLWERVDRKIRPDMEKYGLYFHDSFSIDPQKPIIAIFLEKSGDSNSVEVSRINGIELFTRLDQNAYRGENLGYMNKKGEHFQVLTNLAGQLSAYLVSRPLNQDSHEKVVDEIVSLVKG